jgi:predicted negative regulator of RcsB-dependent stress response
MRILIAVVVLVVVAFFGYRMFQDQTTQEAMQEATQQVQEAATEAAEAAKEAAGAATEAAGAAVEAAGEAAQAAGQAAGEAAQTAGEAVSSTAALVVGGVDIGAELKGMLESVSTTLGGITDQATADAALPSLEEVRGKVDGLTAQVDQLPAEGKKALASMVSAALPALKELVTKVGSIQGAEAVKPALDAMIAKLEGWANAPA